MERQQPVLVGTASIETSEMLSHFLNQHGIKHEVLNAKQHEREANIIQDAGRPGAITIATNMAGRGTDIVLGGSLEAELEALGDVSEEQKSSVRDAWQKRHDAVLASGGLHVLGTERHESRRIDNQLRGRSGRQGDPGSSQFYISVEDNLMRIFAADKMKGLLTKLGMKEDESIQHPWVNKAIEKAQRKVEGHNYEVRKQLLDYDDVANDQRKVIYHQRSDLLSAKPAEIEKTVEQFREEVIEDLVQQYMPDDAIEEQWDVVGLEEKLKQDYMLSLPIQKWVHEDGDVRGHDVAVKVVAELVRVYNEKFSHLEHEAFHTYVKSLMLSMIDQRWREHLQEMGNLRQGIGLRGYAQKNPVQEYKRESFQLFQILLDSVKYEIIALLSKLEIQPEEPQAEITAPTMSVSYEHNNTTLGEPEQSSSSALPPDAMKGVGRNDPCPCGSGKKYKRCCGRIA